MDRTMPHTDTATPDVRIRPGPRRIVATRTRLSLIAAAGLVLFGITSPPMSLAAKESTSEEKDVKSDKKEKEKKESKGADSKADSKTKKADAKPNKTETKAERKARKKKLKEAAQSTNTSSAYGKYVVPGQDRFNCTDFTTQSDAQSVLRLAPQDPNNLDRNRDGIACGGAEAFQDGVPGGFMMPPFDINPVPRV